MSEWFVGSTWHPRIEVVDPISGEPISELPSPPEAYARGPNGGRYSATVETEGEGYRATVLLTAVGEWTLIVETPAPYKEIEVATVYANPVPGE